MKIANFTTLLLLCLLILSCKPDPPVLIKIDGKTMGTYYKLSYYDEQRRDLKAEVDQLLLEINSEVSTYEKNAVISRFNKAKESFKIADIKRVGADNGIKRLYPHFSTNYTASKMIFNQTQGYFDPTVMPLVNYWGFGYKEHRAVTHVDSAKVQSLLQYVGLNKIEEFADSEEVFLIKPNPESELDFGGIAKGYAVDVIGKFLEQKQITNYLVDIGGELRARGKKTTGNWTVGINTPKSEASITDYEVKLQLNNIALATSGNYRNFHEVAGKKYSHTINPKTGYPELNRILSTSVAAKDCTMADGFATAFMAIGLEKAYQIAQNTPGVDAYLIYSDENGNMKVKYTALFKQMIVE